MPREYGLELDDVEQARLQRQAAGVHGLDPDLWSTAGVVPGADVADLGCGPATVLLELAGTVGPTGTLTGVDADPEAVARGRAAIADRGAGNVEVRQGSATGSGLPSASFDAVLVFLVLVHNGGREQRIVDHAASLLRPGGCVFLLDLDTTMIRVQPPAAPVSEMGERFHAYQRARGNDASVGLRLPELLGAAGLEVVRDTAFCRVRRRENGQRGPTWAARRAMVEAGVATDADVERWDDEFRALDAEPEQPRIIGCGFTAIGRKPV